jgi:hypothetical protein
LVGNQPDDRPTSALWIQEAPKPKTDTSVRNKFKKLRVPNFISAKVKLSIEGYFSKNLRFRPKTFSGTFRLIQSH